MPKWQLDNIQLTTKRTLKDSRTTIGGQGSLQIAASSVSNVRMAGRYIRRRSEALIHEALQDTRVVLVNGPRQAGKTTLVEQFVTMSRPYVTLDDPGTLETAKRDPTGNVDSLSRL